MTYLQKQRRDLVFNLDGVKNPRIIASCAIDQHHGTGTDGNQDDKPRNEQDELTPGATASGLRRHDGLASYGSI